MRLEMRQRRREDALVNSVLWVREEDVVEEEVVVGEVDPVTA